MMETWHDIIRSTAGKDTTPSNIPTTTVYAHTICDHNIIAPTMLRIKINHILQQKYT